MFFGDYFKKFYDQQAEGAKRKIDYTLNLIAQVEKVPKKFLKHVEKTDGLYEVRTGFGNSAFRIFCFFDQDKALILLNGFVKKKTKIPKNELLLAEKLRKRYLTDKSSGDRPYE